MLSSPDEAVIQRMVEILSHRGPDGDGIWSDSDLAFGHTRLSIVDLIGSSQPIIGTDNTAVSYTHLTLPTTPYV